MEEGKKIERRGKRKKKVEKKRLNRKKGGRELHNRIRVVRSTRLQLAYTLTHIHCLNCIQGKKEKRVSKGESIIKIGSGRTGR